MKISVSNIAWDTSRMDDFLKLISSQGCQGLELAPSMLWKEPVEVPDYVLDEFRKKLVSFGLEISSMHSLTYTRPDLTFFDSQESRRKLIEYVIKLGRIASLLGIPVMVFGSSQSRKIGARNRSECYKIMAEAFYDIARGLEPLDVTLLIEPLSKRDVDSINNVPEAVKMVKEVAHKNFALHVDLRSSFAEEEDQQEIWSEYIEFIKHCHVANAGLTPPGPDCRQHYAAAEAIRASGYNRYISLEIARVSSPSALIDAIKFVKKVYLND